MLKPLKNIYDKQYKKLFIIPIILLILAIAQISFQTATTGDFVNKGISLKGGSSITISKNIEPLELQNHLIQEFPGAEISVRSLTEAGQQTGITVESSAQTHEEIEVLLKTIEQQVNLKSEDFTIEIMGSALGQSFFKEVMKAMFIAFLFMGVVVFFYFGENMKLKILSAFLAVLSAILVFTVHHIIADIIAYAIGIFLIGLYIRHSVVSFAVILAAASDIVITIAIFNLLGYKLSTAGVAAFLMLIGYSVDTDILLSTRVLKRKQGTIFDRILNAMKTGLTMSFTTIVAVILALTFAQSPVIKQIMIILLIGLLVDLINTWLQNTGILRYSLEKKHKHHENS